jgi:hypothetical protein
MGASSREEIVEVIDALGDDADRLCELSFDVLTTPERLRALEWMERVARKLRTPQHALINQLDAQASAKELGGSLRSGLADRLRITKAEAGRRIAEAQDLGERRALTGEPLAPQLSATAAGQRAGLIGDGHVTVIRSFLAHLPAEVDVSTRQAAEADLADKAGGYRPDELAKYAQRLMDWLHPDGEFSDAERPQARNHAGRAGIRRHVTHRRPGDPRAAGRHRGHACQTGGPGGVQPRRRDPGGRCHPR